MHRRHFILSAAALGAAQPLWAAATVKAGPKAALIVVDVQNCFVDGGTLPVKGGAEVVPVINKLAGGFENIVITQDWHTPGHASFASSHPGKKPFETISLGDLGIDPERADAPRSIMTAIAERPAREAGTKITDEGDAGEQLAAFLVQNQLV